MPNRIDLITHIDVIGFDEAWQNKVSGRLDGVPVGYISRDDYLRNKRAAGRSKDVADADAIDRLPD